VTINIENARRLIKRLEADENPVGFNMAVWFVHGIEGHEDPGVICNIVKEHSCGTVACLAGHAALEAWQSGDVRITNLKVQYVAQEWLGLSYGESRLLFHGHWGVSKTLKKAVRELTKEEAIDELNRLISVV